MNGIAKNNGDWGESITPPLLDRTITPELRIKLGNLEYVNELVDFYSENGIPIEIKTCQEFIDRADVQGGVRLGRFVLDREQHEFLVHKKGYYFFIVKSGSLVLRAKLVEADDITFQRKLLWRPLWS